MQAPPFSFPFFPSLAQPPPTVASSSCPAPPSMMQSSDVASMLSLLNQRMTMIEQLLTLQQHTNDTLFRTVQLMQQAQSNSISNSMSPVNQIKTVNVSDVDPHGNRCLDEDGAEIHVVMVSEGSADVPSSSDLFSSPLSVRSGPRRVAI